MEILLFVLTILIIALSVITMPFMVWAFLTAFRSLLKPKAPPASANTYNTFAVLICARNEENVIANLLDSIKRQDYPGKFYMYVVADNCDDNTAAVAKNMGATVFERNDKEKIGKGHALKYGIECITKNMGEGGPKIDAICIFDADNLVQASFLTQINNALCTGAKVACGYRDTKNIHDSWVTEVYSIYWLMLMRFYCKPRYYMNMSPMVTGTGFAFLFDALGNDGWNTHTVTEDGEFSVQQILKGNEIIFAENAVFYDEQPKDYKSSANQRARWVTGGLQCLKIYGKDALKATFKGMPKAFDIIWYEMMIICTGLAIPLNVFVTALTFLSPDTRYIAPYFMLLTGAGSYLFGCFMAFLVLRLEKHESKRMARGIFLYPAFLITMAFIALSCMFKPNESWVPIPHENIKTIEDIEREPS